MTNINALKTFIKKYYLNGKTESVKWEINNNTLKIKFSPIVEREVIGEIELFNFPINDNIELGINNTSQLLKIISLLEDPIEISYEEVRKKPLKLILKDNNFKTSYAIADPLIIPKPGLLRTIPEFQFQFNINEHINSLIKAKSALPDESNIVHLKSSKGNLYFTFGGTLEHANKISYIINDIQDNVFNFEFCFNSELFKHILNENKTMSEVIMKININGLICIECKSEEMNAIYYLVRKSED